MLAFFIPKLFLALWSVWTHNMRYSQAAFVAAENVPPGAVGAPFKP